MLGYDVKDVKHFTHFTDLIHPSDKNESMQAMTDHYTGKKEFYETTYRIRACDGSYKTFHDTGRIVERYKDSCIVAGIVTKV